MDSLQKCRANYVPLTPITFLERAAAVYSDRISVVYERKSFTWKQTYDRCRRLASSLLLLNISKNDVVSVLAPNVPAVYEMHFAVPMAGAVLNTINTRLNFKNIAIILKHSEAKAFFVDHQFVPLARDALKLLIADADAPQLPLVVVIDDVDAPTGARLRELDYDDLPRGLEDEWDPFAASGTTSAAKGVVYSHRSAPIGTRFRELEYEQLVAGGDPFHELPLLEDEWDPIALNYTSGTTSAPKGVVYSHRSAYLSTMSLLLHWGVGEEPVYLWSLPMFHCNGWTFTWGVAARGGVNVCIRSTSAAEMYRAIADHGVTHMCCAPIVFTILLEARPSERRPVASPVQVLTGGAPPPAALLEKVERMGFKVTHAYGLTEATGPALVCEWRAEWDRLPSEERARLKARQGISVLTLADVDVKDPRTMSSVPRDGRSVGEIVLRGSSIMKGYFKNREDTAEAFKGGWFFTGDVAVVHPDGYLEIKDRSKDVIISGGENISSVEVEAVLYKHRMVAEAAVVAMPHRRWGETPCAFVALKKGCRGGEASTEEEDIIAHCRANMSRFMVPKKVVFVEELPKTATGKIQKFQLREAAKLLEVVAPERPPPQQEQLLATSRL